MIDNAECLIKSELASFKNLVNCMLSKCAQLSIVVTTHRGFVMDSIDQRSCKQHTVNELDLE